MNIRKIAVVLNGFIHDFATGYWLAAIIVIGMLHRYHTGSPDLLPALNSIERFFFWNSIGAVVVIFATGVGRTWTYVDNAFGEATEGTRRRMLIVKHLLLLSVFGAGGCWAYFITFH